ncbi:hypothetical protein GTH10_21235 [Burkholderia thailandensis]|nr:hypothetical protein [Burkholderia thailandensis]
MREDRARGVVAEHVRLAHVDRAGPVARRVRHPRLDDDLRLAWHCRRLSRGTIRRAAAAQHRQQAEHQRSFLHRFSPLQRPRRPAPRRHSPGLPHSRTVRPARARLPRSPALRRPSGRPARSRRGLADAGTCRTARRPPRAATGRISAGWG